MRVIMDQDNEVKATTFTVIAWHCPLQINWSSITADDRTTGLSDRLVTTGGYWYRGWTELAKATRVHCSHLKHVLSASIKFSKPDTGVSDKTLIDSCPLTIWCFVFHQIPNSWTTTFKHWRLICDCAAIWVNITYTWCHGLMRFICHTTVTLTTLHHVFYKYTGVETRYNVLQYNANSVITQLQCWLPFHIQPQYQQLAVMRDRRYADHPHCVTRDGMQQQQRGLLCTRMSSVHLCRRRRQEWLMSNVARLVATGCDVNWSAVSGLWHGTCLMHWSV